MLVTGTDMGLSGPLRIALAGAGCASVDIADDPVDAAERAISSPPDAVVAMGGTAGRVRALLDPLGLDIGPPVIPIERPAARDRLDERAHGVVERVAVELDRQTLRRQAREWQEVVAGQARTHHRELDSVAADGLRRLLMAAEYRDDNTFEHTQRVGDVAARIASALGLEDRLVRLIREAAPLHDLGKIAIPDTILLKPGRLTPEEFEVVKTHAELGARVLADGESDLMRTAEAIARSHHERWDGSGYPEGLAGDAIPVAARVVSIADVFDVLVHERPYKEKWSVEDAVEEIRRNAGTQFDPAAVEAFAELGVDGWTMAEF